MYTDVYRAKLDFELERRVSQLYMGVKRKTHREMAKGKIETLKIVDIESGKVEFQNWYIATPTIGSPFPEYDSSRTWDKWGGNPFGMDGKLYSVVSDETEF